MREPPVDEASHNEVSDAAHTALSACETTPELDRRVDVLIVTDVVLFRDGLARAMSEHPLVRCVGFASTEPQALIALAGRRPRVLLLDMSAPSSLGMASSLRAADGTVKIVGFVVTETEQCILDCAAVGIAGYVTREATIDDVIAAVMRASRDELLVSPRIASSLFRRLAGAVRERSRADEVQISAREREIIRLIDEGMSNKAIAARLNIEVATVKNHVHHILEKLRVSRRGEAAALLRAGAHSTASAPSVTESRQADGGIGSARD